MISPLTDDQLIELIKTHHGKTDKIAEETGFSRRTIQRRIASLAHKGFAPQQGLTHLYPDGFTMGKVTVQRNADGQIERTWERMVADDQRRMEIMTAALEALGKELPKVDPTKAPETSKEELLTVYPIGDPHVGMYSWGEETNEDWDLEIAERIHVDAMQELVSCTPNSKYGWVLNLGDLFHYDSLEAKTPRSGHFLDADGRYAKMVAVAIRMMRRCIDSALQKHEIVYVDNMPGNHDETGALWLSQALSLVYENEPRVHINVSPQVFSYRKFGNVLIGSHHGHTCKPEKLPQVMAADRSKDWGDTKYRYWLTGHIHHEMRKEYPGCTVESFNTLAAKDAYAMNGGWRSGRSLTAIVMHEKYGETARMKVNLDRITGEQ